MKYAITGSTGQFGTQAIQTLLEKVDVKDIVALARNEDKAKKVLPAGIEIRPGSYEDADQLATSLEGVDRLLFISSQPGQATPRLEQHKNVVTAAKKANVKFIAYTSFPRAAEQTVPLAQDHIETEKLIKNSGIAYSFLRNDWYLENEMGFIAGAKANKPFIYSAGDGKTGWALEREYAEAAAKVLLSDDPKKIYEFAGPAVTYDDLAKALQVATGNNFEVKSVSDAEFKQASLDSGMDEATSDMMTSFQTWIHDGTLDSNSNDLPEVLGHELPSLVDSAKEVLAKI